MSRCFASQIRQHDVARPCQKYSAAPPTAALHLLPEQSQGQHCQDFEENSACGHDPAEAFEKKPVKMTTAYSPARFSIANNPCKHEDFSDLWETIAASISSLFMASAAGTVAPFSLQLGSWSGFGRGLWFCFL